MRLRKIKMKKEAENGMLEYAYSLIVLESVILG